MYCLKCGTNWNGKRMCPTCRRKSTVVPLEAHREVKRRMKSFKEALPEKAPPMLYLGDAYMVMATTLRDYVNPNLIPADELVRVLVSH